MNIKQVLFLATLTCSGAALTAHVETETAECKAHHVQKPKESHAEVAKILQGIFGIIANGIAIAQSDNDKPNEHHLAIAQYLSAIIKEMHKSLPHMQEASEKDILKKLEELGALEELATFLRQRSIPAPTKEL